MNHITTDHAAIKAHSGGTSMASETATAATTEAVVRVTAARRHYTTRAAIVRALDGVDLEVHRGEFMAIAGPSGSGKTTLLNLIGALDRPTDGTVWVAGQDVGALSGAGRAELRRDRIGFVFQSYNLIPVLTVFENVEYVMLLQGRSTAERRAAATDVLAAVGLADKLDRRPAELSGGQQQRVAVARALANEPSLLLADEPTAALDSHRGRQVMELFCKVAHERGAAVIVVTHDQRALDVFDRSLEMEDGRLRSTH